MPAAFRESSGWIRVTAAPAVVSSAWWRAFGDPQLDLLEQTAETDNPSLASARAAHRAALATLAESQSSLWPTLSLDAALSGQRETSYSTHRNDLEPYTWNLAQAGLTGSWTPDLWGVAGDNVAANRSLAAAAEATVAGVKLATQTLLAASYFELRQIDADIDLRQRIRALAVRQADIARAAADGGNGSRDDLVRARGEVDQQDAALALLARRRSAADHSLATLVGKPPSEFSLAPVGQWLQPEIDIGPTLPSELLRQRPDVVEALRRVDAADATLKAARGAYFPSLVLGGSVGVQAVSLAQLFSLPTAIWSIGPALAAPLFDGGLRAAREDRAAAARDQAIADYRVTVLAAFQEVEDLLAARRSLAERDQAARAYADKTEALALNQRRQRERGLATVRDELGAQRTALEAKLTWQDGVHQRRYVELLLVKAVGGGVFADDTVQ